MEEEGAGGGDAFDCLMYPCQCKEEEGFGIEKNL